MSALRRSPARHLSIAALLAFALIVKLLVPTGWMPVFGTRGVTLEMCGSYGPPPPALAKAMAEAAHRMAGHDQHEQHDKQGHDQPCAYAGLSFAALDADAPLSLVAAPVAQPLPPMPLAVAIGRGLAAPPPPSTGPPALA
jgi:hypothetical protein